MSETQHTWWTTDVECPKCERTFLNWNGALSSYCEACDTAFETDPYQMVKHIDESDTDHTEFEI